MSTNLADAYPFPDRCLNRESIAWHGEIPITSAAGAVGTIDFPDPAITVTRTGVGTYNMTYPACPKGRCRVQVQSPAGTVTFAYLTARSTTAGTLTFKTSAIGGVADPTTGDVIMVFFDGEARS